MTTIEARLASAGETPTEDEAADKVSEMVNKYSNFVYNIALRMTGNPYDAEDITQETFLAAYKGFTSFRGQAQVSTWLYRIAVNASLMKIRKAKTRRQYLETTGCDDVIVYDWSKDPEKAAINGELRQAIEEGLKRLSLEYLTVVVLRDVQGLDSEEAAEVLGISVSALKSRLHRGRALLRRFLERSWREASEARAVA